MNSKELPEYAKKLLKRIAKENRFSDYLVQINDGSLPGDGFSSELFCVTMKERDSSKNLDLICKLAPSSKNHRKQFHSDVTFSSEVSLHNKFMPIFAKFQEEKLIPKRDQFLSYPKCYATLIDNENEHYSAICNRFGRSSNNWIKMWNKAKVSPVENVWLAMRDLGKFHGLSIALEDQRPQVFSEFKQMTDVFREHFKADGLRALFASTFDRVINSLKQENHRPSCET